MGILSGSFGWAEWEAAGLLAGFQYKRGKCSLFHLRGFPSLPNFLTCNPPLAFFWHFPSCSDTSNPCEVLTHWHPSENTDKSM